MSGPHEHPSDADNEALIAYKLIEVRHKRDIAATLPAGADIDQVWPDLQEYFYGYLRFQYKRARLKSDNKRVYWKSIVEGLDDLLAADPPAEWLADLKRKKCEAVANMTVYTTATGKFFGGRQNAHVSFLYWGVMRVWTDQLGEKLTSYDNWSGTPKGAVLDFIATCVKPILGKRPKPSGLVSIVKNEREDRHAVEAHKNRCRQSPKS